MLPDDRPSPEKTRQCFDIAFERSLRVHRLDIGLIVLDYDATFEFQRWRQVPLLWRPIMPRYEPLFRLFDARHMFVGFRDKSFDLIENRPFGAQ